VVSEAGRTLKRGADFWQREGVKKDEERERERERRENIQHCQVLLTGEK
jgi:hypothetical protein